MIFGKAGQIEEIGEVDYGDLWSDIKKGAKTYITEDLPKAFVKTTEARATSVLQPTVQKAVEVKAGRVVSKGNIALTAGIGIVAGVLVAGGSWERRIVGGALCGILGGLAGLKIGLASDVT